jgi:hypothetical protein
MSKFWWVQNYNILFQNMKFKWFKIYFKTSKYGIQNSISHSKIIWLKSYYIQTDYDSKTVSQNVDISSYFRVIDDSNCYYKNTFWNFEIEIEIICYLKTKPYIKIMGHIVLETYL